MNNWIKAFIDYLVADTDIFNIVGDRIEFMRTSKKYTEPYIIMTEGQITNEFGGWMNSKGVDHFVVIFDIIVPYKQAIAGRTLRLLLQKKLNSFQGVMTPDWSGSIGLLQHNEVLYNEKTDQLSYQSEYLCKSFYDI